MPGRSTNLDNLDNGSARAYCAFGKWGVGGGGGGEGVCGGEYLDIFSLVYHFFILFYPSLWETVRYRLKYWLKRSLNPNNQPIYVILIYRIGLRTD